MKAAVTTDHRDRATEEETLDDAANEIPIADERGGVVPIEVTVDAEAIHTVKVAAEHAHKVCDDGQQWNQNQAREKSRHHEMLDRTDAHAAQGVDLFCDSHRSQPSGHRTPHATRQHRGGEHWTKFSNCLLYTSPSPRDATLSRMPSSA